MRLHTAAALVLSSTVSLFAHDDIEIISTPVVSGQAGELYEYQVVAASEDTLDSFVFRLHDSPPGMTIDRSTGLVQWTPEETGSFRVRIRVEGSHSEREGEQEYTLRIFNGRPSVLEGIVRDQAGQPVPRARLRLFEVSSEHFVFRTFSDTAGAYRFPAIDPGTYLMRIQPPEGANLRSQWYDRVDRIEDATPLAIPESTTVVVNVTLLPRNLPEPRFNLSGNVSDTGGIPLPGTRVFVFRVRQDGDMDPSGNNFHGLDDEDRRRDPVAVAITDSQGNYNVQLRPRTYILAAFKQGFEPQFWDHAASLLEADRLELVSDTSGINFHLSPRSIAAGAISGLVSHRTTGEPVESHVVGLHRSTPDGDFTGIVKHTRTDENGNYALTALPNGFYVVLAVPEEEFLPTFYDTSGGTLMLEQAFPVPVTGGMVSGIDIRPFPDTVGGMNRIRGIVSAPGRPLSGALVFALSAVDPHPYGAAITGTDGHYTIVGVAPGSYYVAASRPGFRSAVSSTFVLQYNGNLPSTATANVILSSPTSAGPIDAAMPVIVRLHQNYPNPFNPTTQIPFQLDRRSRIRVTIYDILGRLVRTLADANFEAGTHSLHWNGTTNSGIPVSSGVYTYRLSAVPLAGPGGNDWQAPIIVSRRMVLMR